MAEPGYLQLVGHDSLKRRLSEALESGRLPQSLLLHGRRGVGKQRLALWTAAALVCSGAPRRPCGACSSCRLAAKLQHPDIHWFFPMPRPKRATSARQLRQKLEDQRLAIIEERRHNRLYREDPEGPTGIYVGAVHAMRELVHRSPAMGRSKILIVGHAEALTPQIGNPEAANAILKILEEPPRDTVIVLTCEVPGALLPTIRSRLQEVRVAPLATNDVAEFLQTSLNREEPEARRLASLAAGSIGRALELLDRAETDLQDLAAHVATAALSDDLRDVLGAAHRFRSFGARDSLAPILAEAIVIVRNLLADAVGAAPEPAGSPVIPAGGGGPGTSRVISALDALNAAQMLAERNINPQLIIANLPQLAVTRPNSTERTLGRETR